MNLCKPGGHVLARVPHPDGGTVQRCARCDHSSRPADKPQHKR